MGFLDDLNPFRGAAGGAASAAMNDKFIQEVINPLNGSIGALSSTIDKLNVKIDSIPGSVTEAVTSGVANPFSGALGPLIAAIAEFTKAVHDFTNFIMSLDPATIAKGVKDIYEVLTPFSCIVPLLKMASTAYNDVKDYSLDRALQAPNLDPQVARELSRVLAIPVIGDAVRNQINLAWMDRYQHITGRGFPSALDQMRYLVSGGVTPTSMISEIESKAPDFFLNNEPDIDKFNKGYAAALKEKSLGKPLAKLPKL